MNDEMNRETSSYNANRQRSRKSSRGIKDALPGVILLAVLAGAAASVSFRLVNKGMDVVFDRDGQETVKEQVLDAEERTVPAVSLSAYDNTGLSVAEVAQNAMPSVVAITSISIQEIPSFFGFGYERYPSTGSGSGIIVGENETELLIATNNHVVEGATTLTVCFVGDEIEETSIKENFYGEYVIQSENAVSAKIKGTDSEQDLAVVAVIKTDIPQETMDKIRIAELGDSEELQVGEQVVAIGNALGYGQSVTSGWVSALNRSVTLNNSEGKGLIQTDAAINPGNSGGALLNMRGELIGINSAKYAANAVEGMGYAIPISLAKPILDELMSRKTRDKVVDGNAGYLGIRAANLNQEAVEMYNMPLGVYIVEKEPGGPADNSGLQEGDIIVKVDGQKVSDKNELYDLIQYYESGEEVEVIVYRLQNREYVEESMIVTFG